MFNSLPVDISRCAGNTQSIRQTLKNISNKVASLYNETNKSIIDEHIQIRSLLNIPLYASTEVVDTEIHNLIANKNQLVQTEKDFNKLKQVHKELKVGCLRHTIKYHN